MKPVTRPVWIPDYLQTCGRHYATLLYKMYITRLSTPDCLRPLTFAMFTLCRSVVMLNRVDRFICSADTLLQVNEASQDFPLRACLSIS